MLAKLVYGHGSGSEVLDWMTAMEGEDSEQPEDTLEQEPVEQDFCLESIQFMRHFCTSLLGEQGDEILGC